jgi:hypothetical protein
MRKGCRSIIADNSEFQPRLTRGPDNAWIRPVSLPILSGPILGRLETDDITEIYKRIQKDGKAGVITGWALSPTHKLGINSDIVRLCVNLRSEKRKVFRYVSEMQRQVDEITSGLKSVDKPLCSGKPLVATCFSSEFSLSIEI